MYGKKRGRGRFGKKQKRGFGRGRPITPRKIEEPLFTHFIPVIPPNIIEQAKLEPIYLFFDEFEATRLVDLEGLTQDEAGVKMNISRGTIWRLLQSGRTKILTALVEGRQLYIIKRA
ncbi:MAG: DUF134 domain-containing protein [Candidatus Helarchaeota archaeon]